VRRATIMTVIALAGQLVPGKHSTLNFLFFTAFVLVISNPLIIYDVSFQLSFFAVLSILLFYPSISRAINHVVPLGKNLTPLISVSISAQMLTFPLILYYFHGFPLVFIISGVVAVIFAYIILCSTAMFFGIDIILPSYTAKAANLLTLVIDLFLDCILALSRIPFSNISRIWVTPIETLYMYAITIGIILLVKTGDWKLGVPLFICFGLLTYSLRSRGMRSKKQIVTHLYQKEPLLADIFIGQKCYELTQASIPLADKKFMVHNHRLAHGINRIQTVIMGDPKIISVE
jgi:competence protein ComEC